MEYIKNKYIISTTKKNIMGLVKIVVEGYRCERCSHEWAPRNEEQPRVCPKCHSPYWDKERIRDLKRKGK